MGGNALKIQTVRLDANEFVQIEKEVIEKLQAKFKKARPTLYYKNKPNFGDLDVLVTKPKLDRDEMIQYLKEEFNTKDIHFNSDVISFEYKDFQIDLIFVSEENFEVAHFYFSYNDLNNLIGRISHKFGLKFGFDGLSYIVKDVNGIEKKKFYLTKEPRKIYEFLDLDFEKYLQGFNEIEDIFKFVITSKYFAKSIFDYENLNHQNRTRNKKRKTYSYFLTWLIDNNITVEYPWEKDKNVYLPEIQTFFNKPDLIEKINGLKEKLEYKRKLSQKFNGKVIMEVIPSLTGKALGTFIADFKNDFDNQEHYETWIETHNVEWLKKCVKIFYDATKEKYEKS